MMKKNIKLFISVILTGIVMGSCADLDLNPPADASSETWFATEDEFEYACNDLYRMDLWYWECNRLWHTDRWTDDWDQQGNKYEWNTGALMSTTTYVRTMWLNTYKGITRCNAIIANVAKRRGQLNDNLLDQYEGEARFFRASLYSYLTFLYGDIPYFSDYITVEQAYTMGRQPQKEVIAKIYEDYDRAAELLPDANLSKKIRVIKATAYAFKARTATWFLDYPVAAEAAKKCMDMGTYSLDADYEHMFWSTTYASKEFVFMIPRSRLIHEDKININSFLPRNNTGKSLAVPSIELFSAFLCTDGQPIDKSPLFDRQNPYKNRDPRLGYTTVEFGTQWLGYEWDPAKSKVMNYNTGKEVSNNDSQTVQSLASWTGLILKKWMQPDVLIDKNDDPNNIIMRYADVLLMYAEAKIEMNEIDQSVYDAINQVRARAYKVGVGETDKYPAISGGSQSELRFQLRSERRMEFAWENRRWFDLMRWRLCDVAMNRAIVSLPAKTQLNKNIKAGNYYFPADALPEIEESGLVNLEPLVNSSGKFRKTLIRQFDPSKGYLLPIPLSDVTLLPGIEQNPGY